MFKFWKKGKQKSAARRVVRMNRGQYKIVDGFAERGIPPSSVETQTEDEILNSSRRGRLLNVTRNLMRNSSLFSTLMLQLESNVVGTQGGKVILNFSDGAHADALRKAFACAAQFGISSANFDGPSSPATRVFHARRKRRIIFT